MKKIAKIFDYITDLKLTRQILSFKNNGYLVETGWLNSMKQNEPLDENKNPIPWVTYSFIEFIKPYLTKDMTLFEFGSGNSTLFYAQRIKKVYTVEHDKVWFEKLKNRLPDNVKINFRDLNENYAKTILDYDENFNIIIIDGRKRNESIKSAIHKIKNNGIIVLDDSERKKYSLGIELLMQNNFRKIDFWGIAPMYFHNKCTSVFCKNFNSFL